MKSPKIRFKEFQNEWNSRILGDICDKFDNLRIPIAENLRKKGNIPYYGANGIQDYVDGYTHDGEFVLIAEDGANDIKNYPVQYVKGKIWVNNHAHVLQGKNGILNNIFLNYSISSINFEPILVGGGRAKLNASVMDKIQTRIPNDIKEQEKIGEFFRKIDEILDLENSRFKKLENFKKTMLDKLFVKNGANEPQIRLGSFKGKWNSRILGDICDVRDGTHDSPQYITKGIPLVTSKNVKNGSLDFSDISYISKDDYLKINERSKVDINDILMGMIGTIGNLALITEEPNYAIKNVALIKNIKKVNHLFLYFQLQSNFIFRQLESLSEGGTQKFIALNRIRNLETRIPNDIKEQEAIGEFFRKIDEILEFSQKKITKLENIKKYLLNKMFV